MRRKAALIGILAFLLLTGAVYGVGVLYFQDHFYPGTEIEGLQCGFMTWQDAERLLRKEARTYALAVDTLNGGREAIYAEEIGLDYSSDGSVEKLLRDQDPFRWFLYLKDPPSLKREDAFRYDEKLLTEKVNSLKCLQQENIVLPEDASIVEKNDEFVIQPEAVGTALDRFKVMEVIEEAVVKGYPQVNLEERGCYLRPSVYQDDPALTANCSLMNELKDVYITYDFADDKAVVDFSKVMTMLSPDEEGYLSLDPEKVRAYVAELASEFDSVGTTRTFYTYSGSPIEVSGGDFGWVIDQEAETEALIRDIENAEIKVKEPVYESGAQNRTSHDIGSTYLEVDLTNQRLVYYKEGYPQVDTPIVSGAPTPETRTPTGVYSIQRKESPAILQKDGMGASVDYWMTFDGDIGFHDSTWRVDYGKDINYFDGTIGCIHVPYDAMASIYNAVEIGTPVVIYE